MNDLSIFNRVAVICTLLLAGCAAPKVSLDANIAVTGAAIQQVKDSRVPYDTLENLGKFYFTLPPPHKIPVQIRTPGIPSVAGIPGTPATPPPPPNLGPLLSFLQQAPGGHIITSAHLQQLVPTLQMLAPLVGSMSPQQFMNSPQAYAALSALQSVAQPLGLWNPSVAQWIMGNQHQLYSVVQSLLPQFNALPTPGTPGTSGVAGTPDIVTTIFVPGANPLFLFKEAKALFERKDELEIAEKAPPMIDVLLGPAGFDKSLGVIYGSKATNYGAGIVASRKVRDGEREVYVVNQEGWFVNPYGAGSRRYWQGEDDITLSYAPFEVKDGQVDVLDLYASDTFIWLKDAGGGDIDLLDRVTTRSTGMIKLNLDFGGFNLRVVGGATSLSSLGGLMVEVKLGDEESLFTFHLGGGAVMEAEHAGGENALGFLDLEATGRTSFLETKGEDGNSAKGWLSLSMSVSGMANKSFPSHLKSGKKTKRDWGFQGDGRLIPEAHGQVVAGWMEFDITTGATLALVPTGHVDVKHPENDLSLVHIRTHFEFGWRLKIGDIVASMDEDDLSAEAEVGMKEWWTDKERQEHRAKFVPTHSKPPCNIFLDLRAVTEITRLSKRSKFGFALEVGEARFGLLHGEFEQRRRESKGDLFLGAGFGYKCFSVKIMKLVGGGEYRAEGKLEIASF